MAKKPGINQEAANKLTGLFIKYIPRHLAADPQTVQLLHILAEVALTFIPENEVRRAFSSSQPGALSAGLTTRPGIMGNRKTVASIGLFVEVEAGEERVRIWAAGADKDAPEYPRMIIRCEGENFKIKKLDRYIIQNAIQTKIAMITYLLAASYEQLRPLRS